MSPPGSPRRRTPPRPSRGCDPAARRPPARPPCCRAYGSRRPSSRRYRRSLEHPLDPVEHLAARIPGLVDLVDQHVDVLGHLVGGGQGELDPVHELVARVLVVAYAVHQNVEVVVLYGRHSFLLYIRFPKGPRFRSRSSSSSPNTRLSSSMRSERARKVRPRRSISSSSSVPLSIRRRAWRSISWRRSSTRVRPSWARPFSRPSGSPFRR